MILEVSHTRMELLTLKKRLKIARKGYKLLKDKLDQLMRLLISYYREIKELRNNFNREYQQACYANALAESESSKEVIFSELIFMQRLPEITGEFQSKLNVQLSSGILKLESADLKYNINQVSSDFDRALELFDEAFAVLIKLTHREESLRLISEEVIRTKRRVNALEYIYIPNIEDTIKYIHMKLEEEERSTKTQIMKIKGSLKAPASHSSAFPGMPREI